MWFLGVFYLGIEVPGGLYDIFYGIFRLLFSISGEKTVQNDLFNPLPPVVLAVETF